MTTLLLSNKPLGTVIATIPSGTQWNIFWLQSISVSFFHVTSDPGKCYVGEESNVIQWHLFLVSSKQSAIT